MYMFSWTYTRDMIIQFLYVGSKQCNIFLWLSDTSKQMTRNLFFIILNFVLFYFEFGVKQL